MGKILIIKGADFSSVAVEQVETGHVTDYSDYLRYGFTSPGSSTGELKIYEGGSGSSTYPLVFVRTAKNAAGNLFAFSDGETKITIPAGYSYRVSMLGFDYVTSTAVNPDTAGGVNSTGQGYRSDAITPSGGTTLVSTNFPTLLNLDTTTYPYWMVTIFKTGMQNTASPSAIIAAGGNVYQIE